MQQIAIREILGAEAGHIPPAHAYLLVEGVESHLRVAQGRLPIRAAIGLVAMAEGAAQDANVQAAQTDANVMSAPSAARPLHDRDQHGPAVAG